MEIFGSFIIAGSMILGYLYWIDWKNRKNGDIIRDQIEEYKQTTENLRKAIEED